MHWALLQIHFLSVLHRKLECHNRPMDCSGMGSVDLQSRLCVRSVHGLELNTGRRDACLVQKPQEGIARHRFRPRSQPCLWVIVCILPRTLSNTL